MGKYAYYIKMLGLKIAGLICIVSNAGVQNVGSTCAGCPEDANLNDFELADKMKEMSVGYYSALSSKNCKLNFEEAINVSSQVVAGTVYRFDAKISLKCGDGPEEITICRNFKFFQPLPFNCNESDGKCVEFMDKEKIACEPL